VSRSLYCLLVVCAAFGLVPCSAEMPDGTAYTNSVGMKFVRIGPGTFRMGFEGRPLPRELLEKESHFPNGDFDEHPAHAVSITKPFYVAITEVTNAQYEIFDPGHRSFRGLKGFSKDDGEAVVHVSWYDAVSFCRYLADKEGLPYRLPTEAEWEYACRAATDTPFHTGDSLPDGFVKGCMRFARFEPVDLGVCRTPANQWGLFDMHGNVEEWCSDWYGPYAPNQQIDPVGSATGDFKVTRGGSHSTEAYYLRSANRLGTLPEDRHWLIGFRVVIGQQPRGEPLRPAVSPSARRNVGQTAPADIEEGPDPAVPWFEGPREVAAVPEASTGPLYHKHSHFMALTDCPNGDLLAAWFTCMDERGRELSVAASRLVYGRDEWDEPAVFWDAPDRNDHSQAFWNDGEGTLYHFNGLGARHRNLAVVLRKSRDNGASWSKGRIIFPVHGGSHQLVVESVFRACDGSIVLPFDGRGGSILALSRDNGLTWQDPGGDIRGTHAGVTQLCDGRLMALGRHGAIRGMMPKSVSDDMGKTWTYEAGPFNSIHTGRRLALLRLRDGSIFCGSFARDMKIANATGRSHVANGLFGALSLDDGKTWPYRRILCEGSGPHKIATMDGVAFTIDSATGEPLGYLSACQSRDGTIHIVSSRNHYSFNAAWLKELPPSPAAVPLPEPAFETIPLKAELDEVYEPNEVPDDYRWRWSPSIRTLCEAGRVTASDGVLKIHPGEDAAFYTRTDQFDGFGAADPEQGFTVETAVRILARKPADHALVLELYDGAGGRYSMAITEDSLLWYEGNVIPSGLMHFDEYAAVARNLDNADAMHTFRIAVRPDGIAHIYRDGRLLGVRRPRYRSPRFSYIMIGAGKGCRALVDYVSYDLDGPYGPVPAVQNVSLRYGPQDCILDTTDPHFSHEGPSPAAGWRRWPEFDVRATFDNVILEGAEDIQTPAQARCKNWNIEGLLVNGKKLFADCSGPGAPEGLYERVKSAVAHVKPLE